jgi:VanZ family protein
MKKFIWRHGPTIFMAVLIFVLSSIPKLTILDIGLNFKDTFYHFIEFGIFGFFLQRSFNSIKTQKPNRFFIVFILGSLYAVLDEFHQSFVPGRISSLSDIIADCLGLLCAQVIFLWVRKK